MFQKIMTHQAHEWQKRTKGTSGQKGQEEIWFPFSNITSQEKAARSPIYMSIYAFIQLG